MSSFALAAQRVRERFAAQWGNTTDVRWDNQAAAGEPPGEFVEVWINEDGSSQIGMPAEINNAGSLIIRINVPTRSGTARALALVDQVAGAFDRVKASGIQYRIANPARTRQDGAWWRINVAVPFFYRQGQVT